MTQREQVIHTRGRNSRSGRSGRSDRSGRSRSGRKTGPITTSAQAVSMISHWRVKVCILRVSNQQKRQKQQKRRNRRNRRQRRKRQVAINGPVPGYRASNICNRIRGSPGGIDHISWDQPTHRELRAADLHAGHLTSAGYARFLVPFTSCHRHSPDTKQALLIFIGSLSSLKLCARRFPRRQKKEISMKTEIETTSLKAEPQTPDDLADSPLAKYFNAFDPSPVNRAYFSKFICKLIVAG